MSEIQFNANLKKAENDESLTEQQLEALAQKRAYLQEQAEDIIAIAQLQDNSALNCLHKINVLGGTSEKAYRAVNTRIITDQDPHGAYHAVAMAQSTSDLPFDVPTLVDIVIEQGEPALQLRLLKLFDSQPIAAEPIEVAGDDIEELLSVGDLLFPEPESHLLVRRLTYKAFSDAWIH